MIKIIEGNIVDAQTDYIIHQVNCQGEMNTGVAKSVNYVSLIQNYFLEHMTSTLSEGKIKRYCPYLHKTSMDMMENSILMLKLFEKD